MTNKHAKALGKLGGNTTKKRGSAYYSKIGKLGALARWTPRCKACKEELRGYEKELCENCL